MKLFIPGPVEVRPEVLKAMGQAMFSHRSEQASAWQREIERYMQIIWNTKEAILLSSSSGTGLMEGALSSCAHRAAIFSAGAFGNRFAEIAKGIGVEVKLVEQQWGTAVDLQLLEEIAKSGKFDTVTITHNETSTGLMNDLSAISAVMKKYPEILWIVDSVSATGGTRTCVDDWGIDIMITSSQKCLGLPPGMAFCTFSEKAKERAKGKEKRGYYFDLLQLEEYRSKNDQYPSTPNLSLMAAARIQLKYIVEGEGMKRRIQRHKKLQKMVGDWVERYGDFFAHIHALSPTVTTVVLPKEKDAKMLLSQMKERGYLLSAGYGKLKETTFRIAHMADCREEEMEEMLAILTKVYENM